MGIGRACAAELLAQGARVVLCARARPELERAAAELAEAHPDRVTAVAADVSDAAQVERVLEAAERAGGFSGLVHAAAVIGPIGPAVELDPAQWLDTIRINLVGSFLVARAACRRWLASGTPGSLVLFSGGGATSPFPHYSAYGCAKAGVVRLAETLAQEVGGQGIRVNCVAPGFVATRMHDATLAAGAAAGAAYLRRTQEDLAKGGVPPELAARTVAFLLSDRAAGITGRLVAAPWDDWERWPEHLDEIQGSDLFTLRRIVPRDRGKDWQ
jgi:NAD(P)-dependent dehydrogenase (short-subunit alcohol dehydrogenase family)